MPNAQEVMGLKRLIVVTFLKNPKMKLAEVAAEAGVHAHSVTRHLPPKWREARKRHKLVPDREVAAVLRELGILPEDVCGPRAQVPPPAATDPSPTEPPPPPASVTADPHGGPQPAAGSYTRPVEGPAPAVIPAAPGQPVVASDQAETAPEPTEDGQTPAERPPANPPPAAPPPPPSATPRAAGLTKDGRRRRGRPAKEKRVTVTFYLPLALVETIGDRADGEGIGLSAMVERLLKQSMGNP